MAALTTWAAIEFLGAPPVTVAIVAFGGSLLIAATQDWMRRHPESR